MLVETPAWIGLTNRWSPRRFGVTCQAALSPTRDIFDLLVRPELDGELVAGRGLQLDHLVAS